MTIIRHGDFKKGMFASAGRRSDAGRPGADASGFDAFDDEAGWDDADEDETAHDEDGGPDADDDDWADEPSGEQALDWSAGEDEDAPLAFPETLSQIAQASEGLANAMRDIVAQAITSAFGQIEVGDLPSRAVAAALETHGRSHRTRVLASAGEVDVVRRNLAEWLHGGAAPPPVEADGLLGPGEVVVESVLGRMHVGAEARARLLDSVLRWRP